MAEGDYKLVEPFDIDNGELDGIRPQIVFCLGYECCQIRGMLETKLPFARTIHAENVSRVKRMLIRRKRQFKVTECEGEAKTEWAFLTVDKAIDLT